MYFSNKMPNALKIEIYVSQIANYILQDALLKKA